MQNVKEEILLEQKMEDSMSKQVLNIWNRDFEIDITYEIYSDKPVTEKQKTIASGLSTVDFSGSLEGVINYIKKYNSRDLGDEQIDNIFRYVIPKRIYITQSEEEEFAIMCNYKFDMEHGIAVVYKGGKFKEAGPQDIIL